MLNFFYSWQHTIVRYLVDEYKLMVTFTDVIVVVVVDDVDDDDDDVRSTSEKGSNYENDERYINR